MTAKQRKAMLAQLKPGAVVEVTWIDSGRDVSSRDVGLARCVTYGVVDAVEGAALRLGMDLCVREDGSADPGESRNHWGLVWLPAILSVSVLRRAG